MFGGVIPCTSCPRDSEILHNDKGAALAWHFSVLLIHLICDDQGDAPMPMKLPKMPSVKMPSMPKMNKSDSESEALTATGAAEPDWSYEDDGTFVCKIGQLTPDEVNEPSIGALGR